jgi:hypothetical protein
VEPRSRRSESLARSKRATAYAIETAGPAAVNFVGSHTVAALLRAGHDVRLLIRDATRIPAAFEPPGAEAPADAVLGDVTEPDTVERLLDGCDAVVHAASISSFDTRDTLRIRATNVGGTRLVIEAGCRLRLDPIVHVAITRSRSRSTQTRPSPRRGASATNRRLSRSGSRASTRPRARPSSPPCPGASGAARPALRRELSPRVGFPSWPVEDVPHRWLDGDRRRS